MTAAGLLTRAHAAGLAVVAEGGNLRLRGAVKPPADLLAELRTHKADVLALLTAPANDQAPESADHGGLTEIDRADALARLLPPPAAAPELLAHIRDVLHCRVTLEGETVAIRPTHRCPPAVLAAALKAEGDLRALVASEAPEPIPMPATEEQVEDLAAALLAHADACPATTIPDQAAALRYFRSQARGRLASTNDAMARGLLVGWERHAGTMAVHGRPTR